MTKVADLGLSKGKIVETVVSTYNEDGKANAAPMGVTLESQERLAIRIFTSSLTYKNFQSNGFGVINLTCNADVFYRTAIKEANPNGEVPQDWFEKAETVDAPRLRKAEASIEVAVAEINQLDADRALVLCDVRFVQTSKVLPKAYCRALFATVEAIIHATRIQTFIMHSDRHKREQASKLLEKIKECQDIVNRVAPNSSYSRVMDELKKKTETWRSKGESLR
jgi:hypothetical protein